MVERRRGGASERFAAAREQRPTARWGLVLLAVVLVAASVSVAVWLSRLDRAAMFGIDRRRLYSQAFGESRVFSGPLDTTDRAAELFRGARRELGQDGSLTEEDIDFLATEGAEWEARIVSDRKHRVPEPAEIRAFYDEHATYLRNNEERIRRFAEDGRKVHEATERALGK